MLKKIKKNVEKKMLKKIKKMLKKIKKMLKKI